jgi:hypothetical protein
MNPKPLYFHTRACMPSYHLPNCNTMRMFLRHCFVHKLKALILLIRHAPGKLMVRGHARCRMQAPFLLPLPLLLMRALTMMIVATNSVASMICGRQEIRAQLLLLLLIVVMVVVLLLLLLLLLLLSL